MVPVHRFATQSVAPRGLHYVYHRYNQSQARADGYIGCFPVLISNVPVLRFQEGQTEHSSRFL